ncbi:5'-nucleotidase C-terminal domain-containing protein [Yoonia sp. R2331]|uniref:5'-nucleotidase C-terminal domain-containing protein n=1 Tax=Yoonia sp. R2331 TaxID=3237238 RepID=UPI0034E61593
MVTAQLRLLQTTDLHMHLLGYDYLADGPAPAQGLTELAPLIAAARDEGPATLLFDNGDFLQGNPVADHIARHGSAAAVHPMIAAFNTLDYDAITLGNHEFDYGLDFLMQALSDCTMPVVSANVRRTPTRNLVAPWTVLTRDVQGSDGQSHQLKIGVIGFVTPQVVNWDAHALGGAIQTDDILDAARSHLPALRRAGADVVVALCHAGISDAPYQQRMENAALHLAGLPGIDVVLAGHTHDRFPGPDFAGFAHADTDAATLHGKPGVMAASHGQALGVIDLDLLLDPDTGWRIDTHHCELRELADLPTLPATPASAAIARDVAADQDKTLAHLGQTICDTPRRLTSYFAAIGRDDTAPLVAAAQLLHMRTALAKTDFADLPLLATTSPYRAGGHGGPGNYIDVEPGPMARRHVAAIVPFENPICGVLRRGWQIRHWLENASRFYNVLKPGLPGQKLLDPAVPAYHFDQFHGLRYRIDLTTPPRDGDDPTRPARVRDITYEGAPLADDALFLVATSSYRAHGGGGLSPIPTQDVVYTSLLGLPDILIDCVANDGIPATPPVPNMGFLAQPGTGALFPASPATADIPLPCDRLSLLDRPADARGFRTMQLTL